MTSKQFSTRVRETVESLRSTLDSMRRPLSEVHGCVVGLFVLKKQKCVESGVGYFVRHAVCLSPQQVSELMERLRAAVLLERSLVKVLCEPTRED